MEIKLTQYSHGSGCGCKVAPAVLEEILKGTGASFISPNLLVGNETKDDAAVYDMGNGTALISTVDFFTPIVNDPFSYGKIAAASFKRCICHGRQAIYGNCGAGVSGGETGS